MSMPLEGYRTVRFRRGLHPDDRTQEDAGEHLVRLPSRRAARSGVRGRPTAGCGGGTGGRSPSLHGATIIDKQILTLNKFTYKSHSIHAYALS